MDSKNILKVDPKAKPFAGGLSEQTVVALTKTNKTRGGRDLEFGARKK